MSKPMVVTNELYKDKINSQEITEENKGE